MYVENFVLAITDSYGLNGCDKGSLVKVRMCGTGSTYTFDMTPDRITVGGDGNIVLQMGNN